jgi:hypothetical protein
MTSAAIVLLLWLLVVKSATSVRPLPLLPTLPGTVKVSPLAVHVVKPGAHAAADAFEVADNNAAIPNPATPSHFVKEVMSFILAYSRARQNRPAAHNQTIEQ